MENFYVIAVAVLAGMSAYAISIYLNKGAVFGSAVVTLVSGLIFPYFVPSIGAKLAIVATCASYAGMVAVKNVPKLWEMAIVSFIAGVLFVLSSAAYVGVGGKLGVIGAISCFSWIGFKKVMVAVKASKKSDVLNTKVVDQ
ncbi:hypothetical protein [Alkaliphilus peptidifermentans]|uniref:Uncharacterized protein n=1 Tax=Alkaliphilus peptidifermentans DSM 18978 TaxID=1120976 RepID=A0A1G5GEW1_9FIRM|nr:hypothetical protein [Alkaliphilus peptidifermentans]SCY49887.1 hypothetical protein SAMN03080606_01659 [Alkaliphilus peptidifermentans DSM 18978]